MSYINLDSGVLHLPPDLTWDNFQPFLCELREADLRPAVETITIHITSLGGAATPALAVAQAMRTCSKPVRTIGAGMVASGAVSILAAGAPGKRELIEGTHLIVHEPQASLAETSRKQPGLEIWQQKIDLTRHRQSLLVVWQADCA